MNRNKSSGNYLSKLFALYVMAVLCLLSSSLPAQQTAATKKLKDVYKDAFLMGTAVTPFITSGRDSASHKIVTTHFNSITVENVMKACLVFY